jgi:hypothetical protein
MKISSRIRKQIKEYEREGFHVVDIQDRAGSHKMVTFAEFPEPQIVTDCKSDWRAFKNNIARYRRLKKEHEEKMQHENSTSP